MREFFEFGNERATLIGWFKLGHAQNMSKVRDCGCPWKGSRLMLGLCGRKWEWSICQITDYVNSNRQGRHHGGMGEAFPPQTVFYNFPYLSILNKLLIFFF